MGLYLPYIYTHTHTPYICMGFFFCSDIIQYIYFQLEANYNIVVVFVIYRHESATGVQVSPHILNPASHLPPHHIPLGCPTALDFGCLASCIKLALVIYFTYGDIHVSMPFSYTVSPSPSPTQSKNLFFTSMTLLLSCIQGHCYCLICMGLKQAYDMLLWNKCKRRQEL